MNVKFSKKLFSTRLWQVFSNKPHASDRDAVFVLQVDLFAGLFWIYGSSHVFALQLRY